MKEDAVKQARTLADFYTKVIRPSALVVLRVSFWYFFKRPSPISPTYASKHEVKTVDEREVVNKLRRKRF